MNDLLNPLDGIKFGFFDKYYLVDLLEEILTCEEECNEIKKNNKIIIVELLGKTFNQVVHNIYKRKIDFIDCNLECFTFDGVILVMTKDFNKRKYLCEYLENKINLLNFKFRIQSYSKIGWKFLKFVMELMD